MVQDGFGERNSQINGSWLDYVSSTMMTVNMSFVLDVPYIFAGFVHKHINTMLVDMASLLERRLQWFGGIFFADEVQRNHKLATLLYTLSIRRRRFFQTKKNFFFFNFVLYDPFCLNCVYDTFGQAASRKCAHKALNTLDVYQRS